MPGNVAVVGIEPAFRPVPVLVLRYKVIGNDDDQGAGMIDTTGRDMLVVDADAHILEPADLWVARVPEKYRDQVPHVEVSPRTNHHHWRIGPHWLWPVGHFAQAGWKEYPPLQPWEFEDVDPASYDPSLRLNRMDEYGIDIQILYPNVIGFQAPLIFDLGPELALLCTQVYNDFMVEWCSADPQRLIPIAMLPYWDREEAVREMRRCVDLGFRGVLFANKFEQVGLPSFCDAHWDAVYAAAQDLDIPVNFHIGFSNPANAEFVNEESLLEKRGDPGAARLRRALAATSQIMAQCDIYGTLLTSGICDRFPNLKLVSVESAFGHIPFYLETLDWQFRTGGMAVEGQLLPSEYFARQCYGTLWFEETTLSLLENYPDNFMFSTDYPHPTSLSPGPASPALAARDHIGHAYANIDGRIAAKLVGGNASSLYKL